MEVETEIDTQLPAQVLYVGGLSPGVTHDDLTTAFNGVPLLAASFVTLPNGGPCIGHAYVTVAAEHMMQASQVEQVGDRHVAVFPVDIKAWTSLRAEEEEEGGDAAAAAAAAAAAGAPVDAGAAVANGVPGSGPGSEAGVGVAAPPAPAQLAAVPAPAPPPVASFQAALAAFGSNAALMAPPPAPAPPPAVAPAPPAVAPAVAVAVPNLPVVSPSNVHLQQALDLLRAEVAAGGGRIACADKRLAVVLNDLTTRLKLVPQPVEGPGPAGGPPFLCTIHLLSGGTTVVTGVGGGANKKDAKHAASEACLDGLLQSGRVKQEEVVASLRVVNVVGVPPATPPPMPLPLPLPGAQPQLPPQGAAAMAAPAPAAGGGGPALAPCVTYAPVPPPAAVPGAAHTPAMATTAALSKLGVYPRAMALMAAVQAAGTEAARAKNPCMAVQEYAAKRQLTVAWSPPAMSGSAGPFKFSVALLDGAGAAVATATGLDLPSKQEAKHAAAAALMEELLFSGRAVAQDFMGR